MQLGEVWEEKQEVLTDENVVAGENLVLEIGEATKYTQWLGMMLATNLRGCCLVKFVEHNSPEE